MKYSKNHVSVNSNGKVATIGITETLLENTEYITNIRFPDENDEVGMGDEFVIETTGKNIDLILPVTGTIIQINEKLINNPELLMDDPEKYWICKISLEDPDELEDLISYEKYLDFCEEEKDNY